jgi:hypothetical protein
VLDVDLSEGLTDTEYILVMQKLEERLLVNEQKEQN